MGESDLGFFNLGLVFHIRVTRMSSDFRSSPAGRTDKSGTERRV